MRHNVLLSDRHKWSTLSFYIIQGRCSLVWGHSASCRACLEMAEYLWILLLSVLSPPVISTSSTCPTKDPVLMVLKSSDEIGALHHDNLILLLMLT